MSIVGIDIGGTFTDLVGYQAGAIVTSKCSTVPADPTEGAALALRIAGCDVAVMDELLHGSTIAINTVLERRGAKTALITTEGFHDVYAIGRGNRPDAFNLFFHRPRPLVPRELTFELAERMNAAGEVLVPLDPAAVEALGRKLTAHGVEAVAVCLLHSYANPAHEAVAGAVLRRHFPALFVTLSHEILREFREYERTSTTVLNAFVGPRVDRYLGRFEGFAQEARFAGKIAIMRSNGGTMSIAQARREPVAMMESGPVAGMIGAARLADLIGIERAIGFDMGGTTAKCTLITGGVAPIEEGYVIGDRFTGQPMQLPVVDIVEVVAGGGSLAWCDAGGGLHVGPVSAGADPGPACYGRGGEAPAVTDADLVLGRRRATPSPLRSRRTRPVDRDRQSAAHGHGAAHGGCHGTLAVGALDADGSRIRAAPAGRVRRSRSAARDAHPVAAGPRGGSSDRRTGGDRGAEFDHAHRPRRSRRGGRERAHHRDIGGAGMMKTNPITVETGVALEPGDRLTFRTAGGGGWGDPRERDRGEVARDIAAGYVSPEAARRDYGGAPAPANAAE